MARRRFRDYTDSQARRLRSYTLTYYLDARGTALADVQTIQGVTIPASTVTVPAGTRPPDVLGPDFVNELWAKGPEGMIPLRPQGPKVAKDLSAPQSAADVALAHVATDFTPGAYTAGALVVSAGLIYRRRADGIASTWVASDWDVLGSGYEIAYAERTTDDTTTNVTLSDAALMAALIPGLSLTVVGKGRPVEVEFQSHVMHTTAQVGVSAILMVNGHGQDANGMWVSGSSPVAAGPTAPRKISATRRLVLADGVSYTFEVGKHLISAGTGTFVGNIYRPTSLAVIAR